MIFSFVAEWNVIHVVNVCIQREHDSCVSLSYQFSLVVFNCARIIRLLSDEVAIALGIGVDSLKHKARFVLLNQRLLSINFFNINLDLLFHCRIAGASETDIIQFDESFLLAICSTCFVPRNGLFSKELHITDLVQKHKKQVSDQINDCQSYQEPAVVKANSWFVDEIGEVNQVIEQNQERHFIEHVQVVFESSIKRSDGRAKHDDHNCEHTS